MVTGLDMSSKWSIDMLLFPAQLSVDLYTTDSCMHAHLENMKACIQSKPPVTSVSSAKYVLLCSDIC